MTEMDTAIYKEELWYVYNLFDDNNQYNNDYRLQMRKASQANEIKCAECGENLILCAGNIRFPYLRHHKDSDCVGVITGSNIVYRHARTLLFDLAKRSYLNGNITCNKKIGKYRADIYIEMNQHKLVFEYIHTTSMILREWEDKHKYYQENGIQDVWFINAQIADLEKYTNIEYLVSNHYEYINIISSADSTLTLKCCIQKRFYSKEYNIIDITYTEFGIAICDFQEYLKGIKSQISTEMEQNQKLYADKSGKNSVRQVLTEYRQKIMDKKHKLDKMPALDACDNDIKRISMQEEENELCIQVPRLNESWILPVLDAKQDEILKKGYANRIKALKYLMKKTADKDALVEKMLQELKEKRAYTWYNDTRAEK